MANVPARPATNVIDALADHVGVDPTALTPPLGAAVDPDALNALVERADTADAVAVSFDYEGHEVVVRGDGRVAVQ